MVEPKRLTPEEMADIMSFWIRPPVDESDAAYQRSHANSYVNGTIVIRRLITHIAAQDADLATAHQLLCDLTEDEAGIAWDDYGPSCIYCNSSTLLTGAEVAHAPDCPIVRGRALVKQP